MPDVVTMPTARMDVRALYRESGDDLILFVHGLGCRGEQFAPAWAREGLRACSLLAPDLPGHGDSIAPDDFPHRMEDHAAVLRNLLGQVSFRRLHMVAHSLGGAPALLLFEPGDLPLASFTCVEGNLVASDCGLLSRRTTEMTEQEVIEKRFPKLLSRVADDQDWDVRLWRPWLARTDPRAFYRMASSVVSWSDSGRLLWMFRGLPVPRPYVCGSRSKAPGTMAYLTGEQVTEIPDCGHFPMNEKPDAFYGLLEETVRGSSDGRV